MPDLNNLCMGCMGDKAGNAVCPSCGFNENEIQSASYMPLRYLLDGRYLIGAAIESNCEGVTYLAWDTEENVAVRVREYFPEAYCARATDGVSVGILPGKEHEFNRHLDQFIDIARCLLRCNDLPSLFPVIDIFEANYTAYFVTTHVKTITMREFLIRNGGSLGWNQIRPLIMPVITTLSSIHAEGLIHCGISPETLIVGVDGRVRITGFCVPDARTVRRDSITMNAQLFPGFAAIEQYEADAEQGTWTDVYGLCATLYKILVGSPPADATERVTNDKMIIPAKIAQEIPRNVLSTLADGLAILSEDRTQTMDDLKSLLIPTAVSVDSANNKNVADAAPKRKGIGGVIVAITIGIMLVAMIGALIWFVGGYFKDDEPQSESNALAPSSKIESTVDGIASADTMYEVPDLHNKSYPDAVDTAHPKFELEILDVKFDKAQTVKGVVLSQDPAPGTMLKGKSKIKVVVSLGSTDVKIPNLKGKDEKEAIIELMKLGFDFDNIEFASTYDAMVDPNKVVSTLPEQGSVVTIYSKIKVYINSYNGNGNTVGSQSGSSSSESSSQSTGSNSSQNSNSGGSSSTGNSSTVTSSMTSAN